MTLKTKNLHHVFKSFRIHFVQKASRFSHSTTMKFASSTTAIIEKDEEAKKPGDISAAFVSLSGVLEDAKPLDDRYRVRKTELLGSDQQTKQKWMSSWATLLRRIRQKAEDTNRERHNYVPTIDYADVKDSAFNWHLPQKAELGDRLNDFSKLYRERGVAVIRNVIPQEEILALKEDLKDYISRNKDLVGGFPADNKQVFELYWTKAQIVARAHPSMRLASQFALSFWHGKQERETEDQQTIGGLPIAAALPVAYCDRLRMRLPGDTSFALGPHVDGGSIERWEKDGYGRGDYGKGTYAKVWAGDWESHDPWYWPGWDGVESDIYKGIGACSVFRAAQGWLALSDIAPGEGHLKVNPMLKEATAYYLMRPFFEPIKPKEEAGTDFLNPENWKFEEQITVSARSDAPVSALTKS
jgi:hypothetical protein